GPRRAAHRPRGGLAGRGAAGDAGRHRAPAPSGRPGRGGAARPRRCGRVAHPPGPRGREPRIVLPVRRRRRPLMINQLRGDLYAIPRTGPVLLCLAVSVIAAALYTWLQHSLAAGSLVPAAASGVQVLSDALMVSLMGPLLFGALVAQPFETKSVHNSLLASGRGAFVGAKTLLTALAVTALSLPYGIAALIGLATGEEFAPAIPTAFSLLLAEGGGVDTARVGEVLALTVTMAVLTTAKLSVCLPLAFQLRRPLVVMAVGFVWGFLADLIGTTAADVDGFDALVRLTPFARE